MAAVDTDTVTVAVGETSAFVEETAAAVVVVASIAATIDQKYC